MATRQPQGQGDLAAEPRSVELRDYALVVRRRWVLVLVMIVLGAALGAGYAKHKGHVYAATSQVVVEPATQGPLNPPAQPNLQVNMVTEQAVAQSALVAGLAAKLIHGPSSAAVAQGRLASHLTVTVPVLSNILQITWQSGNPKGAQRGANAFANAYLTYRHDILSGEITRLGSTLSAQITALQRQIKSVTAQLDNSAIGSPQHQNLDATLSQLNDQLRTASDTLASLPTYNVSGGYVIGAALPVKPVGLGRSVILLLGALLGLLAGVVAAFVRDAFDDRLRDPEVLERKLGAPTLAILPGIGGAPYAGSGRTQRQGERVVTTVAYPDSAAADAVRALRTTLTSVAAGKGLCSIVVVGVDGSVVSSQVAAELSVALAESGKRTLLIAADIRHSTLPQIFGLHNASGLTNVLVGKAGPTALAQHPRYANEIALSPDVARELAIIPNGPPIAQPLAVLDSVAMARFLKGVREDHDFVVLDCPPADAAADFLALSRLVDGVVAVASEIRSKGQAAEDLRRRLDRVDGYLVGGIFIARGRGPGGRGSRDRVDAEPIGGSVDASQPDGALADRDRRANSANGAARQSSSAYGEDVAVDNPKRATRRIS